MAARGDLLLLVGGRLASVLLALVSIRLSTTLLPPEQYGILALLVTFQVFCGLFLINPVGQYINRHTHEWVDDHTLLARLSRYRRYVFFAGLTGALAFCAWATLQPLPWSERLLYMVAVTAMVLAATWNATSVSLLNMLGLRSASVTWAIVTSCAGLLISGLLVVQWPNGLAWFAGQAAGMAMGAVGAGRAVRRCLPVPVAGDYPLLDASAVRSYILPLAAATGFMWWQLSGFRLLIEHYWGLAALGMVAVGLGVANQLWSVFESLVMQFLFPLFYRRIAASSVLDGQQAFSDLINSLGPMYLVFAAATLVAAPALVTLFLASSYEGVRMFVFLGMLAECTRALGNLFAVGAQVEKRMGALILPYAVGAVLLTSCLIFAAGIGANILQAIGMVIFAGLGMLVTMILRVRRLVSFKFDTRCWIAAILLFGCIACVGWMWQSLAETWIVSLGMLMLTGLISVLAWAVLYWMSPGIQRLLSVRLMPTFSGK
ncbi:MAG: Uncharacterized protein FD131_1325 [Rhodocyclaceae bacterium]|nr:MAG: Uncharacterized protein FD131_1325 [Rhodocyclaceae bacterium]